MMAVLGGLLGLILGSFIASLTLRWPRGQGIVRGRSVCEACGHGLAAIELVPVASYLILRGRCGHCGVPIAARHLWVELVAGAIGAVSVALLPGMAGLAVAVFGWLLLTLAILDFEHFWLPDALTLALGAFGLASGFWLAPAWDERLIGAAAGFLSLDFIASAYRKFAGREGLGGGDPKLLAGIGAWLGWQALAPVVLAAAVLGLVMAALDRARGRRVDGGTQLPLGGFLAAAAWPVALVGWQALGLTAGF